MENPNWRQVLASILGISVLGVIGYLGGARTKQTSAPTPTKQIQKLVEHSPKVESPLQVEQKEPKQIVLDIGGAVTKPGVYWLYEGARLQELVVLAGGLLPNADRDSLNMAQALKDGAKVTIPYNRLESSKSSAPQEASPQEAEPDPTPGPPSEPAEPQVVRINQATALEFEGLPAIGQELAARIVKYREGIGGFKSVDEIKQVRGIGDKLFERIRVYLTL